MVKVLDGSVLLLQAWCNGIIDGPHTPTQRENLRRDVQHVLDKLDAVERERDATKAVLEVVYQAEPRLRPENEGMEGFDGYFLHYDTLLRSVGRAWPTPQEYSDDPLELVTRLVDERDAEREARQKAEAERDAACASCPLPADFQAATCRANKAEAQVERLQKWVDDLHSGMYVNCVYCGHRYGPRETTPVSMADALKTHIEKCPKHPMSALKAQVERLRGLVAEYFAEKRTYTASPSEPNWLRLRAAEEALAPAMRAAKGVEP